MKKFNLALLLLFTTGLGLFTFFGPIPETQAIITSPMSNAVDAIGTQTRKDKVFITVKNTSGGTLASGSVVIWDTAEDNGMGVTTTTTQGNAAACVTESSITSNALGQCQVYGYHAGIKYSGDAGTTGHVVTATAGKRIYTSQIAGYASGLATEFASGSAVGVWYDTTTASGNFEGFVNTM